MEGRGEVDVLTVQLVHWTKSLVMFLSLAPPVKSGPGQSEGRVIISKQSSGYVFRVLSSDIRDSHCSFSTIRCSSFDMAMQESWQIILGPVAALDSSGRINRSSHQPADISISPPQPRPRIDSPYRSKHSIDHLEFTQDEHNIVLAYLNIVKLLFVHPSCSTNLVCRY
jgi:hypothetical protein